MANLGGLFGRYSYRGERIAKQPMQIDVRHLLTVLALVWAGYANGCERQQHTPLSTENVRVFATVQCLGDLARQVGGKYVEVDFAIESGRSLLGFQPDTILIGHKSRAQIVLAGGSEPWAATGLSGSLEPTRVLRLDSLRDTPASQPVITDAEDAQIGLEWLDPVIGKRTVEELARRLTAQRPDHTVYFEARAKQFTEQLDALVKEYEPKFRSAKRRRVMSLTHEFDYLAQRFDLEIVHVLGTTVDRIGNDQITTLQRVAREEHLVTLLVRADTPQASMLDLARRTDFRIIPMDPYGSSISPDRDSYLELLRYNMDQLLDALNGGK